jgi:hypothetical protein
LDGAVEPGDLIGQLSPPQAETALAEPAADQGVSFEPGAIDVIVEYTEGYPLATRSTLRSCG